jgi:hypothetical protein
MRNDPTPGEIRKAEEARKLVGKNFLRVINKNYPVRRDRDGAIRLLKNFGFTNFILARLTGMTQAAIGEIIKRDPDRNSPQAPVTISALRDGFARFYYGSFRFDLDDSVADEIRRRVNQFRQDCLRLLDPRRRNENRK